MKLVLQVFTGLILTLLFVGFLSPSFSVQPSEQAFSSQSGSPNFGVGSSTAAGQTPTTSAASDALGLLNLVGADPRQNGSVRLMVGLDGATGDLKGLDEAVSVQGGNVTNTISVDGKPVDSIELDGLTPRLSHTGQPLD